MVRRTGRLFGILAALATAGMAAAQGQTPSAVQLERLEAMRKAADDLDEAADPAGYRRAWEEVVAFGATLFPPGHPELAALETEFITADYLQGDIRGALARTGDLIERLRAGGAEYADRLTDVMNGRMVILMTLARHDEARVLGAEILERRRAQYGGQPSNDVAAAYSNYANAEYEFGNYERAIELVRQAIAEAERLETPPPNAAIWYSNLPVYLGGAGRLEEAIEASRAAAARMDALLPPDHPFQAPNLNTMSQLLLQLGRASEAEVAARRAVEIAESRFGRRQQTAAYMTSLAEALNAQGKAEEGRAVAEAAIAILEETLGAEADRTLTAKEVLARAMVRLGDRDSALALQRSIMDVRSSRLPPHHRDRIDGGDRMAMLALDAGDLEAARDAQAHAQALRRDSLPADDLGALAGEARLGAIEVLLGNRAGGLGRALAAAEATETRLERIAAAGLGSARDTLIRSAFGWALEAAVSAGDEEAAFRLAQRAMMTSTDWAVARAAARQALTDPELAELVRRRQDIAAEMERQLDRQMRAVARGDDAQSRAGLEAERAASAAQFARLTQQIESRAPGAGAREVPETIELAQARQALGDHEALLVIPSGERRSALFVATREASLMLPLDSPASLAELVRRIRAPLQPLAAGMPFDFDASADLHGRLFPAPVRQIIDGKDSLLLAANGALAALPFATLAPAAPDGTPTPWLIRSHALTSLPSVAALSGRAASSGPHQVTHFVAIGAPVLEGATVREGTAPFRSAGNRRLIAQLPPLPATEGELSAMGEALDAPNRIVLTGPDATESGLRSVDLESADLIAFATHGLVTGELDGLDEPALVMTPQGGDDGLLTASEIMRLRIGADWIILSACNTAAGDGGRDEGLTGLARAFLHAGARNLLASHWSVRDDSAAKLSVETVQRYADGSGPAEALRRAMLEMIDRPTHPDDTHPAHWAPFVLVGR